jgi:hypothetical protein
MDSGSMKALRPDGVEYTWPDDYTTEIQPPEHPGNVAPTAYTYTPPSAAQEKQIRSFKCQAYQRDKLGNDIIPVTQICHDPVWLWLRDQQYFKFDLADIESIRSYITMLAQVICYDNRALITGRSNVMMVLLKQAAEMVDVEKYLRKIKELEKALKEIQDEMNDLAVQAMKAKQEDGYLASTEVKRRAARKPKPRAS